MRLILCNHDLALTHDLLQAFSAEEELEAVDVIEGPGFVAPPGIPCTYFSREALYFGDYDVDWSTIRPLDQSIADALLAADVYGRTMFSRYEKYTNQLRRLKKLEGEKEKLTLADFRSHDMWKLSFLRHVRFWHHRITTLRPDAFIHVYNSPHVLVEYLIWQICKALGVRSIWLTVTAIPPKLLVTTDDLGIHLGDLEGSVKKHLSAWREHRVLPELDRFVQSFMDKQVDTGIDPHPKYINAQHTAAVRGRVIGCDLASAKIFIKDVLDACLGRHSFRYPWLKYVLYLQLVLADRRTEREYNRLARTPDLNTNFIYYPLHTGPEESLSPLGGVFEHQLLVAEMISRHLPPGWKLYVKEHPVQGSFGREFYLYRELVKLRGVELVTQKTSTFELTRRSRAVATISGTVGWEALVRGKPVLVFGEIPYAYASGAFRVRTTSDCQAAMTAIASGDYEITAETMRCFLRGVQDCSIDGWLHNTGVAAHLSEDLPSHAENVQRMTGGFLRALRSRKEFSPQPGPDAQPDVLTATSQ